MSSWCPPMFDEAPQRYTKRLFLYAMDEIAETLRQKHKVKNYVADNYEYMAQIAWLSGASSAAQALIREIDVVKSAWGRGDEDKTLLLIKVCTPHMISAWVGGIDQQTGLTGNARELEFRKAASSMLGVINKFLSSKPADVSVLTTEDVKSAIDMDGQWDWQGDGEGRRRVYACLLLSKALEACGQRCIDWGRLVFPVESVEQLADEETILYLPLLENQQRLPAVLNCMDQGIGSVKRYHKMNMEGKVQPLGKA